MARFFAIKRGDASADVAAEVEPATLRNTLLLACGHLFKAGIICGGIDGDGTVKGEFSRGKGGSEGNKRSADEGFHSKYLSRRNSENTVGM